MTLFPKNILVLLAIASINLSSKNWGVSFNLFASASFMVLYRKKEYPASLNTFWQLIVKKIQEKIIKELTGSI